jgi:hypothetical protein
MMAMNMNPYFFLAFTFSFLVCSLYPATRRTLFVLAFGVPCMIIGYLFGYLQSGFITGYMLYRRFDGGGK